MTVEEYQQKKESLLQQLRELDLECPTERRIGEEYYYITVELTPEESIVFYPITVTDYGDDDSQKDWDNGNYFNNKAAANNVSDKLNQVVSEIFKEVRKNRNNVGDKQ